MPQFVFGACIFIPIAILLTRREELMAFLDIDHELKVAFTIIGALLLLSISLFIGLGIKDLIDGHRKKRAARERLKKWGINPEDLD